MPSRQISAWSTLLLSASLSCACGSPARAIRPVMYVDLDGSAAAMKAAPTVLVVRIGEVRLTGDMRNVERIPGPPRSDAPAIPLHLARINAEVLLTVKGQERSTVEFYSWIWASGKHGGPRLFFPYPDTVKVIFLRDEGGYLHTVGDYPAYDLEFTSDWLSGLRDAWKSGRMSGLEPIKRLVALVLRIESEGLTEKELREGFGENRLRVNYFWAMTMQDLIRIEGPYFVATQLDDVCLHSSNPPGRFAACVLTAQKFPGRCEAYQLAQEAIADGVGQGVITKMYKSCRAAGSYKLDELRKGKVGLWYSYLDSSSQYRRREELRVYASAMNQAVREAACDLAAKEMGAPQTIGCNNPKSPQAPSHLPR